jgi:hypothetical protein
VSSQRGGPSLGQLLLIVIVIFVVGWVALALFGGQTSHILSNVSAPV